MDRDMWKQTKKLKEKTRSRQEKGEKNVGSTRKYIDKD